MTALHPKTIYEALGREPVHPFPARMAPGIALDVLANTGRQLRVLDPMVGSGTVLALARANGHRATGFDIDPLAVLISNVWTTTIDIHETRELASRMMKRAKKGFATTSARDAYPDQADRETRKFVAYWFDDYSRRQLAALATAINREANQKIRAVLWCTFSRLIITKQAGASLAMDLSHSRPHRRFSRAPVKPFNAFPANLERVLKNCISSRVSARGLATKAKVGDARRLPLGDASMDLVLTSPPYLNAIDYIRCSKFSLVWMGHSVNDLGRLRGRSVGTERGWYDGEPDQDVKDIIQDMQLRPTLSSRHNARLVRYIIDMRDAVREVARVLSRKGKAVYIVGDNTVRGTQIRNSRIIRALAELSGLRLVERRVRTLPANRRYLPPPAQKERVKPLDGRMRQEVVLAFQSS